ncbi:MAG: glycosyl hydrolase family 18 protein [bacterium]|nr:glycosyl hydrolase family 18 protein [bacterium]
MNPVTFDESPHKEKKVVYDAWIPEWDSAGGLESLKLQPKLRYVSPVWYSLSKSGVIVENVTTLKDEITSTATESGALIVPTIGNSFDRVRTHLLLSNRTQSQIEIDKLVSIAISKNYAGFDIDWEELAEEDGPLYSKFIEQLAQTLHKNKKIITVSLHARTGDPFEWVSAKAHDYKELNINVDMVRIMAYDFHNPTSEPGPITPDGWLDRVIRYSKNNIDTDKLVISLPFYGYDWTKGTPGVGVTYKEVEKLKELYNPQIKRDGPSGELNFEYTKNSQKHTVWFVDKFAVRYKIALSQKHGIYQFCFWRLGGEDPETWI